MDNDLVRHTFHNQNFKFQTSADHKKMLFLQKLHYYSPTQPPTQLALFAAPVCASAEPYNNPTDLRVLLVRAVDDRRTTDFGDLLSVSVVRPTANLLTAYHVFDEHNPAVESQRQLVKQLDVLQ